MAYMAHLPSSLIYRLYRRRISISTYYNLNFYEPINIHGPFFWRIWLKLSGIARNGQSRIPLFYFFEKIFFF